MSIRDNIIDIDRKIKEASASSPRHADVTIVGVTKYSEIGDVIKAYDAGLRVFAENRVQMLMDKLSALDEIQNANKENGGPMYEDMKWHLIGHLQTNKVKYIVGKVDLIQSVDTLYLAEAISKESVKKGVITNILLEVNVSGEESKSGMTLESVEETINACAILPGIKVLGLMTMAPKEAPKDEIREIFTKLYKKAVDIENKNIHNVAMKYVSMGMSGDFEVAVSCGSNMVRIGHAIFTE